MASKMDAVMKLYHDTIASMEKNPDEWLGVFQRRLAACKDPTARLVWQAGISQCKRHIAGRKGGK